MLTGSAITRALVIIVLAAALAGLWQALVPHSGPHLSEPPKVDAGKRAETAKSAAPAPTSEGGDAVRSVYPGPRSADPPAPRQPPVAEMTPVPAPSVPPPSAAPAQAPDPSPPPVFTPPVPSAPLPADVTADTTAEAPPAGAVDLNTASLAELNGLGGGMIGKAIIARRPYAAPGDLLSKRVLSRATYDKIKGLVTVR